MMMRRGRGRFYGPRRQRQQQQQHLIMMMMSDKYTFISMWKFCIIANITIKIILLARRVGFVKISPSDNDTFHWMTEPVVTEHASPLPCHVLRTTNGREDTYDRKPRWLDVRRLSVVDVCRVDIRQFGIVVHHLHNVCPWLFFTYRLQHCLEWVTRV